MRPTSEHDIRQALRDEGLQVPAGAEVSLAARNTNAPCQVCGVMLARPLLLDTRMSKHLLLLCPDRIGCQLRVAASKRAAEKGRADALKELLNTVTIGPIFEAAQPNEEPHE